MENPSLSNMGEGFINWGYIVHGVIKHWILKDYPNLPVGRFYLKEDPQTKEIMFGTKQCEERLFTIVKEHCDEFGRWIKNPNDTVRFTKVKASKLFPYSIECKNREDFKTIYSYFRQAQSHTKTCD